MLPNKSGNNQNEKPMAVVRKMLSKTYDSLEVKDLSREEFVNQCTEVMAGKVNNKSKLHLPGRDF